MTRWLLLLLLPACAGPNRTEPRFVVTLEMRRELEILLPKQANVVNSDPDDCGQAEVKRAEATLGAIARELGKGGFKTVTSSVTTAPLLEVDLDVELKECSSGLFGDVLMTLSSSRAVDRIELRDDYFSNVAGLAETFGDRVAASEAVRAFVQSSTLSVDRPAKM